MNQRESVVTTVRERESQNRKGTRAYGLRMSKCGLRGVSRVYREERLSEGGVSVCGGIKIL